MISPVDQRMNSQDKSHQNGCRSTSLNQKIPSQELISTPESTKHIYSLATEMRPKQVLEIKVFLPKSTQVSTTAKYCSQFYKITLMSCIIKGIKRSVKKKTKPQHPYFKSNTTGNPRLQVMKGKHLWSLISPEKWLVWTYSTRLQHAVKWKSLYQDSCLVIL